MQCATKVRSYHTELDTGDDKTLARLRAMSAVHQQFIHGAQQLSLDDYLDYTMNVMRLARALEEDQDITSNAPMFYSHGDRACSNIWYEVVHAGVKCAHAVIERSFELMPYRDAVGHAAAEDRLRPFLRERVDVAIAMLCFVIDTAFDVWLHPSGVLDPPFQRGACIDALKVLRALRVWVLCRLQCGELNHKVDHGLDIDIDEEKDDDDVLATTLDDIAHQLPNLNPLASTGDDSARGKAQLHISADQRLCNGANLAHTAYLLLSKAPRAFALLRNPLSATDHTTKNIDNACRGGFNRRCALREMYRQARRSKSHSDAGSGGPTWLARARYHFLVLIGYYYYYTGITHGESARVAAAVAFFACARQNGAAVDSVLQLAFDGEPGLQIDEDATIDTLYRRSLKNMEQIAESKTDLFVTTIPIEQRTERHKYGFALTNELPRID
eukprot:TRINITY_DN47535_c0_g1_i1.p1 TRINITY_DN47535_c0_g1~~TRINITY_DN47535_c0_g1_i1.p1  ORF type:complete len:442 (+),score=176.25 TRINITY_DN47535_c0_g1_i1:268-1593(+)